MKIRVCDICKNEIIKSADYVTITEIFYESYAWYDIEICLDCCKKYNLSEIIVRIREAHD